MLIRATDFALCALRELADAPSYTKVPRKRPERFIRVDQAPPVRYSPVSDRALVIVQLYAPRTADGVDWVVAESHRLRGELVHNMQRFSPLALGWDEVQGPHEFPDPDLPDVVRWQFSGNLYYTPTY